MTYEQHKFELCWSTFMQFFSINIMEKYLEISNNLKSVLLSLGYLTVIIQYVTYITYELCVHCLCDM